MPLDLQMKLKQMKDTLLLQKSNIINKTNNIESNLFTKPFIIRSNTNNNSKLIENNAIAATRAITDASPVN